MHQKKKRQRSIDRRREPLDKISNLQAPEQPKELGDQKARKTFMKKDTTAGRTGVRKEKNQNRVPFRNETTARWQRATVGRKSGNGEDLMEVAKGGKPKNTGEKSAHPPRNLI